jgi:hypothetical protein
MNGHRVLTVVGLANQQDPRPGHEPMRHNGLAVSAIREMRLCESFKGFKQKKNMKRFSFLKAF